MSTHQRSCGRPHCHACCQARAHQQASTQHAPALPRQLQQLPPRTGAAGIVSMRWTQRAQAARRASQTNRLLPVRWRDRKAPFLAGPPFEPVQRPNFPTNIPSWCPAQQVQQSLLWLCLWLWQCFQLFAFYLYCGSQLRLRSIINKLATISAINPATCCCCCCRCRRPLRLPRLQAPTEPQSLPTSCPEKYEGCFTQIYGSMGPHM